MLFNLLWYLSAGWRESVGASWHWQTDPAPSHFTAVCSALELCSVAQLKFTVGWCLLTCLMHCCYTSDCYTLCYVWKHTALHSNAHCTARSVGVFWPVWCTVILWTVMLNAWLHTAQVYDQLVPPDLSDALLYFNTQCYAWKHTTISWCLLTCLMHCYTLDCYALTLYAWKHTTISWCLLTRLMDQLLPLARQPLLHSQPLSAEHCTQIHQQTTKHSGEKVQCSAQWWGEGFNGRVSLAGLDAVLPPPPPPATECKINIPNWNISSKRIKCVLFARFLLIVEEVETIWFYDFSWKLGEDCKWT